MHALRPLTREDLDLTLEWRNQPEIRKSMFTQHVISLEEHFGWFEKVKDDKTKRCLIFTENNEPLGVVNFYDLQPLHKTGFWGFYVGMLDRKGLGTPMGQLAIGYAFDDLGLDKLSGEVLSSNERSLKYHQKLGFQIEGCFKNHFFDGEKHQDLYRLAILKQDGK